MARYRIILVDSDVISHFIAVGMIDRLDEILAPNLLFLVDDVYHEVIRHPLDSNREEKVDSWITSKHITRIPFPFSNEKIRTEFYRIKKAYPMLDSGERACMAMARFARETIASSNFKDIKQYAEDYGIDYIGCIDILYIAWKRGLLTLEQCNQFIADAVLINHARFPVQKLEDYVPDRDLTWFLR